MNGTRTCGNCNYFCAPYRSTEGICQRYPPTVLEVRTAYPSVYKSGTCGEWKVRFENEKT